MPPRGPRTALLLIAAGFFALGIASVILRPRSPISPTFSTPAATSAAPNAPQETALILGVDDLQSESPHLVAVWLAAHRPPGDSLFLFGLPVDAATAEGPTLEESFAWSSDEGPDPAFLDAVRSISPLPLEFTVVLDETAFAGLIDFLGGVELDGADVGGREVLGVMSLLTSDPSAALEAQRRLLEALARRAQAVGPGSELQPLVDLIPDHAFTSIPASQVLTLAAPLLPLTADRIHVSLPVPEPVEE
jgi:hypothetical protein